MELRRTIELFGLFVKTVFLAPISLSKSASKICGSSTEKHKRTTWPYAILFWGLFIGSISFFALQTILNGSWAIGMFLYFCFCGCVARLRMNTRNKLYISGHAIEDFIASIIMYPSVAMQLEMTLNARNKTNEQSNQGELNSSV